MCCREGQCQGCLDGGDSGARHGGVPHIIEHTQRAETSYDIFRSNLMVVESGGLRWGVLESAAIAAPDIAQEAVKVGGA